MILLLGLVGQTLYEKNEGHDTDCSPDDCTWMGIGK
jgi:hypothetical protein